MADMKTDGYYTGEETAKRKTPRRTWVYGILLIFVLWLFVANHVIIVTDDPALVILEKTSWTFNSGFIGESSWTSFTLHHPILMGRLVSGDGLWILGESP